MSTVSDRKSRSSKKTARSERRENPPCYCESAPYFAFRRLVGPKLGTPENFQTCYVGTWDSDRQYAEFMLVSLFGPLDDFAMRFVNVEKYEQELFENAAMSASASNGCVYVFKRP